jgi:hypothetical protein
VEEPQATAGFANLFSFSNPNAKKPAKPPYPLRPGLPRLNPGKLLPNVFAFTASRALKQE